MVYKVKKLNIYFASISVRKLYLNDEHDQTLSFETVCEKSRTPFNNTFPIKIQHSIVRIFTTISGPTIPRKLFWILPTEKDQ